MHSKEHSFTKEFWAVWERQEAEGSRTPQLKRCGAQVIGHDLYISKDQAPHCSIATASWMLRWLRKSIDYPHIAPRLLRTFAGPTYLVSQASKPEGSKQPEGSTERKYELCSYKGLPNNYDLGYIA